MSVDHTVLDDDAEATALSAYRRRQRFSWSRELDQLRRLYSPLAAIARARMTLNEVEAMRDRAGERIAWLERQLASPERQSTGR